MNCFSLQKIFSLFLFFVLCTFAVPGLDAQQYNFFQYSVQNGLPQSEVRALFQDRQGYIWIGTVGGAFRFDGREFDAFDTVKGISSRPVSAITEDDEGVLLGMDSGITVYSSGTMKFFRPVGGTVFSAINSFFKGEDNETMLATDNGIFSFHDGIFHHIVTGTPLDHLPATTGYLDNRNHLWIGTQRNGIFQLDVDAGRYSNISFNGQEQFVNMHITGITENVPGELWIATAGDGIFSYEGHTVSKLNLPAGSDIQSFSCMHRDAEGNIWLGTYGNGVVEYAQSVFKIYDKRNGLADHSVTCITTDAEGDTWIGTYSSGVIFFQGGEFTRLTLKDGLPNENINGIASDDNGNIWLATLGGLAMYDGADVHVWTTKNGLGSDNVGAVASCGKKIFAGGMNGVLSVIDDKTVRNFSPAQGNPAGEITSLLCTPDGNAWIGTMNNGLFLFSSGKMEPFNTGNALLNNAVFSIYEANDGKLWIGTEKGVFVLDNGSAVRPTVNGKSIPESPVYSIQGDSGYVYFSTERYAIWRYSIKKHTWEALNAAQGLGSDFTKALLRINDKTMYITNVLGMDRVTFFPDTQRVRHFFFSEGIGTSNFARGVICQAHDGNIWIGSTDGAIIYSPQQERNRKNAPHVILKNILLSGEAADWKKYSDSITKDGLPVNPSFAYNENQLSFRIAAIQYGAGVNVHYAYMLDGLEKEWNNLSGGNTVSYSNLPPGNYRLLIRAGNSNNVWSDALVFPFTIKLPFWSTWWFFLIVLVLISGSATLLIFLYRRFRTDFVRRSRSFGDHQVGTARMILFAGGILFPISFFFCHSFMPALKINLAVAVTIGVLMLVLGSGTYFNALLKKFAMPVMQCAYSLIILDLLYICQVNHISLSSLALLLIALGAGTIIFDNIRSVSVFAGILLLSTILLMSISGENNVADRWLLLLGVIVILIIIFIGVFSRINLFNRLVFADTTISNTRSLVIAGDKSGKIIFVSRSIRTLLGYTEDEVLGDGWWKLRSDNQEENERIRKKIHEEEGGIPTTYITPIKAKNGTLRWIQWVDTEIEGGVKVGIGVDVSDRREIEERYRHIVESANDIIYTADYRGNLTYINDVAKKITGYEREELIGKHFTQIILPDWTADVRTFYERQFQKRTSNTYFEFPITGKNNKTIWLGQSVKIIFDELRPNFIRGFQAIARDITEKKNYEEELEKLSLVASETINGVLICDPGGKIEWVNEGFTRITGYHLHEVKGRLPGDVLAGDRTDLDAISMVREQSKKAEGFHREFLVYDKRGNEVWLAVSNTPIVDEHGKILKQIEIFNDITEKKRYEIQLNKYSMRLETLNMAKHELLRSNTVSEIAENVLGSLARRINYVRRTSVALFDEKHENVELIFVMREGKEKGNKIVPVRSFRSYTSLLSNRHVIIHDLENQEELSESDRENLEAGVRSYLVMPMFSHGQLIGSVNVGAAIPNSISDEDVEMVREVAETMATAILQMRYRQIIEQKNADINASILYARRIQESILPPEEMLREEVGDLFVLHKPKDQLSGDFYWAEKRDKYTFLAVADSTGHGIPGALLSLMGQNLLNQAVHERYFTRPAAILDYLNAGIQHTLNQYKRAGELRDGMDIALCVFEEGKYKMHFAGAVNPMYIIRNDMLIQSNGNRFSIGSYFDNRMRPFTNQETEMQPGDVIYLFTDGYPDQFGGENDRKLSHKRFRELLISIHKEEMSVQKRMLEEQLNTWMKGSVQTDDICVIGIRVK